MTLDTGVHTTPSFTPADGDDAPCYSMEELLRQEPSADAAALSGPITFVDNGTDRWSYSVTPGTPGLLTLQLQVSNTITWWKTVAVWANWFGTSYQIRELATKDDRRVATTRLSPVDAQSGTLKLDFWKGGVGGFGAYLTSLTVNVGSNLGQQITYRCDRD